MIHVKMTLIFAVVGAAVSTLWLLAHAPEYLERRQNTVRPATPDPVSRPAAYQQEDLFIADLHADSLLWERNLLDHSPYGHVDIPRLIQANVAIQAFTVVTRVPTGRNLSHTPTGNHDLITYLAVAQRWPLRTWASLKQRALYQADKFRRAVRRSDGELTLLLTRDDLTTYLLRRNSEEKMVAGILGLEGAHALEGKLENIDELYAAGFRMLGLVHHFDNEVGGSSSGKSKGGLTGFGEAVIGRAEALGMVIDLAHASPALIDDVLNIANRPVVASHMGVRGTCDNNRNLSDRHVRGIAKSGGVIGIGYWPGAVCGGDAQSIARAIRYAVDLAAVEHVALGSDFDGAIEAPFDVTGIAHVTEALAANGFSAAEIRQIMGGNVLRVLREVLE